MAVSLVNVTSPTQYHLSQHSEQPKKVIAVDIDEVLAQFVHAVCLYHNDVYKTNFSQKDFLSYSFNDTWGGTVEEAMSKIEDFFKSDYFKNLEVVPGAQEGIDELARYFDLVIVSSRQFYIQDETMKWLNKHFPNKFNRVLFGNHWTKEGQLGHGISFSKKEMCLSVEAIAFIDDCPKYVDDTYEYLEKVILFDLNNSYGWNKSYVLPSKNVIRCTNWSEVVMHLKELA